MFQAGDHGKDPFLFRELEVCLEADDIVERGAAVILAQLDDGVGDLVRTGQFQADGLHGAEAERIDAAAGHDFYWHAAFKDGIVLFKVVQFGTFGRRQGLPEGLVFFFRKGAVQIVGTALAVAGCAIDLGHIEGIDADDGCCGIVEMEIIRTGQLLDCIGHGRARKRPCSDDANLVFREFCHFFVTDGDERVRFYFLRNVFAEGNTVDGESTAGRHARSVGGFHDERAQTAHFFLQKTDGIFDIGRAQGVAADELRK